MANVFSFLTLFVYYVYIDIDTEEQYFLQICRGDEGISTAEESRADALAKALAESKSESEMLSLFYNVAPLGSCGDTGG